MVPPQPTFVITMVVVFWVGLVVATNIWSKIEKKCRGAEQNFFVETVDYFHNNK